MLAKRISARRAWPWQMRFARSTTFETFAMLTLCMVVCAERRQHGWSPALSRRRCAPDVPQRTRRGRSRHLQSSACSRSTMGHLHRRTAGGRCNQLHAVELVSMQYMPACWAVQDSVCALRQAAVGELRQRAGPLLRGESVRRLHTDRATSLW
jgi:hypothetical protein